MSDLVHDTTGAITTHLQAARAAATTAAALLHAQNPPGGRSAGITRADWLDQISELLDEIETNLPQCVVCRQPIERDEHQPHDPGCVDDGCCCDNPTHARCCWECSPPQTSGRCPHCSKGQVVLVTTSNQRWSFEELDDDHDLIWSFAWSPSQEAEVLSTRLECQICGAQVSYADAGIDGVEWGPLPVSYESQDRHDDTPALPL